MGIWGLRSSFIALCFVVSGSAYADVRVDTFQRDLKQRSLNYFLENTHSETGLVLDRATNQAPSLANNRMASIAATGFGLATVANASLQGLISREAAVTWVNRTLRGVSKLEHRKGWLYHFVDWETGVRFGDCEISTVDTAWLIAGALYAAQVLGDATTSKLSNALFERMDFIDMLTDGGTKPSKKSLSMGWVPESGYLPAQWDSYAEQMILVLLGLGHPTRPLPAETWNVFKQPAEEGVYGRNLPLFVHQYSHLFVDFRKYTDGTFDYFKNSVVATSLDRAFAGSSKHLSYREGFWGLSASGSNAGYQAFSPAFHNGTVCPGCAGASVIFDSQRILSDMKRWREGKYGKRIWGRYGFTDSLNLEQDWVDPDVIGITVGALYLALADLDEAHSIWRGFEKIPAVRNALMRAGLSSKSARALSEIPCFELAVLH